MRNLSDMMQSAKDVMRPNVERAQNAEGGEKVTLSSSILSTFSRRKSGRE
jgi:hypothetical protein